MNPIGTLDRYVFKEIATPFAVGLGLFFSVVCFAQVIKVSDSVTGLGITGQEVVQALLYSLPPLIGLLIPVSALFATLLGVGRLASDREIKGLCAAGLSPYALLRVPALLGLLLALVSGYAMAVGEPWGIRGLRDLMTRSAQRTLAQGVRVGQFVEWVPGVTFLAQDEIGDEMADVMFADRRNPARPLVISAKRGVVQQGSEASQLVFHLRDGSILLREDGSEAHRVINFGTSDYRLDVGYLVGRKTNRISPVQEKTMAQLWDAIHDPNQATQRALHIVTLNRKVAVPLATLIFALMAVPLASRKTGGARAWGFLFSAGIVGAYYYIGRVAEISSRSDGMNPILAAWTPNLLGVVGLVLLLARFKRSAV